MEAIRTETRWIRRAIPTEGAAQTAVRTADDGHGIRADLFGMGATLGEPYKLIVTCETLPPAVPGEPPIERWPTMPELFEAADELTPGVVLKLVFFGNPKGVDRVPVPPGAVRSFMCEQIGQLGGPDKITVLGN